jgi:hypothetical protein
MQQATDWERLAADALKQSRRKQRTEAFWPAKAKLHDQRKAILAHVAVCNNLARGIDGTKRRRSTNDPSEGSTKRDDMIIMEVMTKHFDLAWWKKYRKSLETAFRQEEIVIRVHDILQV